jgi:hypothetical protein
MPVLCENVWEWCEIRIVRNGNVCVLFLCVVFMSNCGEALLMWGRISLSLYPLPISATQRFCTFSWNSLSLVIILLYLNIWLYIKPQLIEMRWLGSWQICYCSLFIRVTWRDSGTLREECDRKYIDDKPFMMYQVTYFLLNDCICLKPWSFG